MNESSRAASALSTLSQSIKGYCGYESISQRELSDRVLRQQLISRINLLRQELDDVPKAVQAKDQNRLDELVSSSKRKLHTITESLTRPTYVGVSFFKKESPSSRQLMRIYQFEAGMLAETDSLSEEISLLNQSASDREVFEDHFLHIQDFIDNVNQALFEREALILGDDGAM
jgi:hypothetical protein